MNSTMLKLVICLKVINCPLVGMAGFFGFLLILWWSKGGLASHNSDHSHPTILAGIGFLQKDAISKCPAFLWSHVPVVFFWTHFDQWYPHLFLVTSPHSLARSSIFKVVCACRLFNNVQYISRFFISCQFIEFMSCCQGDLWHILTLPCTSHGSRCTYAGTGFRNIGSPAFGMKRKPFLGRKLTKKISFNIILFFE